MAFTGVNVYRAAGHKVPKDYFDKVSKAFPTCFGTVVNNDEGFATASYAEAVSWEQFNALQENYLQSPAMYYFGNYPEGFKEEDLQPYTLIVDDSGNPILVAFVTGALPRYDDKAVGTSGAQHMVDTYLRPKIGRMYLQVDSKLPDLLTLLRPDDVRQELTNLLSDNGTITICAEDEKDGTFLTFTPEGNQQFRNFPWGSTTNHLGTEVVMGSFPDKTAPSETASDKLNKMMSKPRPKVKLPGVKPKDDEKPKDVPGVHIVPDTPKPATAPPPEPAGTILKALPEGMRRDEAGALWYRPPKNVPNERNALKADYIEHCGYTPRSEPGKGLKRRPEVLVAKEMAAKYGTVLPTLKAEGPVSQLGDKLKEAAEKKDTAPKHVSTNNTAPTTVPIREAEEPILSAMDKSKLEDWYLGESVQKVIGADSKEIMSFEQMLEVEKKYPNFLELLGMEDWEEVSEWPFHVILNGVENNPKAFAIGFMNLCIKLQTVEVADTSDKDEPEQVGVQPDDTPKPRALPQVTPPKPNVNARPKVKLPASQKVRM